MSDATRSRAADLTLVSSGPVSIVSAIKLARAAMAVIHASFAWARLART